MIPLVIGIGASGTMARYGVERGLACLKSTRGLHVRSQSQIYLNPPMGGQTLAPFANAAVWLETFWAPEGLLRSLRAIEAGCGRVRTAKNAPRMLDLDILWSPEIRIWGSHLTIPHPSLLDRDFALLPLWEVSTQMNVALPWEIQEALRRQRATTRMRPWAEKPLSILDSTPNDH